MPDEKKLALSRRQLLGGLGAVGAASAGAGLGTTALFSDTESFNNNTIQAGTTNLKVEAAIGEDGSGGRLVTPGLEQNGTVKMEGDVAEGDPVVGLTVKDLKPGDAFCFRYTVIVEGNPMYVGMIAENISDDEGLVTEPETDVDGDVDSSDIGTGPLNDNGELLEKLSFVRGYEPYRDSSDDDPATSPHHDNTFQYGSSGGQTASTPSEVENNALNTADYSSAEPYFDNLAKEDFAGYSPTQPYGRLLKGQAAPNASPVPGGHYNAFDPATRIGSDGDPYDPADNVDRKAVTIWTCFRLPSDVGNVVQGDSLSWDLRFVAEQVRNNPAPDNATQLIDGSPN